LVAESISKETPHIFVPKRWNRFFAIYVVRLALYVCLKNIRDGVGSQNGSNGTPLDPPLFWLDNIFKKVFSHSIDKTILFFPPTFMFDKITAITGLYSNKIGE
jgi:hypothetical protein